MQINEKPHRVLQPGLHVNPQTHLPLQVDTGRLQVENGHTCAEQTGDLHQTSWS